MTHPSGEPFRTDVIIVGAGPAGLAVGACLRRAGILFEILERGHVVGSAWHRHYERLHLHTDKARSELPYLCFPPTYPKYPSRGEITAYLETYTREFGLAPRFGERVVSARHRNGLWHVRTDASAYLSAFLIVATGVNGEPHVPTWPGQDSFEGQIVHSSQYTTGAGYRGKRVLVVGLGNSGGEIAIDLWEHGAIPALSVRSPINIIPRDLLGIPILAIAIPLSRLPAWLADALTAPVVRLIFGDQRRLGLRKPPYGPFEQIRRRAKIPLIDVGTIGLVRAGRLDLRPDIAQFTPSGITFTNGRHEDYDAVILATGYRPAHGAFLEKAPALMQEGKPIRSGRECESPGLYLCGFYVSPTGMLREIAIEARTIARDIARKRQMAKTEANV